MGVPWALPTGESMAQPGQNVRQRVGMRCGCETWPEGITATLGLAKQAAAMGALAPDTSTCSVPVPCVPLRLLSHLR